MQLSEAQKLARKYNLQDDLAAKIVRILPADIDPVKANDNGWDVEVEAIKVNDHES